MAELTLTPLTDTLAAEAAEWFHNDEEGQREFGGFYGVHPNWWDLVRTDKSRRGWIALLRDHTAIGFVDLELTADNHLSYYIRREFRRRGLCPSLVQAAVAEAKGLCAPNVTAAIRPGHTASLACCRRAGFVEVGENGYGEIVLRVALGSASGRAVRAPCQLRAVKASAITSSVRSDPMKPLRASGSAGVTERNGGAATPTPGFSTEAAALPGRPSPEVGGASNGASPPRRESVPRAGARSRWHRTAWQ